MGSKKIIVIKKKTLSANFFQPLTCFSRLSVEVVFVSILYGDLRWSRVQHIAVIFGCKPDVIKPDLLKADRKFYEFLEFKITSGK